MRKFFPLLFPLSVLAVLIGSIIYLAQRFSHFFETGSLLWIGIFSFVLIYMIAGLLIFSNSVKKIGSIVYKIAAVTTGYMLYLLLSLLFVDLINWIFPFNPLWVKILVFTLPGGILIIGLLKAFHVKTTHHQIKLSNYTKKLKIAHLSDIHIGHFRGKKFLQKIVDRVNKQNPDLVVISGDFFDGRINLNRRVVAPLKSLKAPVYFVNGNHDVYSGLKDVFDVLSDAGVNNLKNQLVNINGIQLIGLNHMRPNPNIKETLNALPIDKDLPSILLHHSPDGIEYANQHGVNLYLSGHTHGGQQFPITLLNELLFTYNRGLHTYKSTQILVSEGIGTFGPPIRVGTKSEIIIINIA